jgi:pyridoxamine 5'-phosphate oxidase
MTLTSQNPLYYNDLDLSFFEAVRLLKDGAINRRARAHTPVVATIDANGCPSQRTLILRQMDIENRRLRFHTDTRSAKVAPLIGSSAASVLVYDPEAKIQLRLRGMARIQRDGAAADDAWEQSTLFARRCYMAEVPPGQVSPIPTSGLPTEIEGKQPPSEEVALARPNFALLLFEFDHLEWLYLASQGHRRAQWQWDNDAQDWLGSWLIP